MRRNLVRRLWFHPGEKRCRGFPFESLILPNETMYVRLQDSKRCQQPGGNQVFRLRSVR
jgi:hypothetical protein